MSLASFLMRIFLQPAQMGKIPFYDEKVFAEIQSQSSIDLN